MCGIFGYANYGVTRSVRQILEMLVGGLQKIEYRGYDSAGIAVDSTVTQSTIQHAPAGSAKTVVVRSVGNIAKLRSALLESPDAAQNALLPDMDVQVSNHIGVAHTRWATHGKVCVENAHPQQSNHGEFTIVHNGIMTNFMTMKQFLIDEGYAFTSETDTEVIAVLAEYLYTRKGVQTFLALTAELCRFVEGSYALLIKSEYFPHQVMACRRGSPLVVGIREVDEHGRVRKRHVAHHSDTAGSTEIFFASDINTFASYTSNVVYLEDDDLVLLKDGDLDFYTLGDVQTSTVVREFQQMETKLESLSKGSYPHFMLKEIHEQTESLADSLRGRLDFSTGQIHLGGFTEKNCENVRNSRRLLFISCGTSLHSCLAARPLFEELLGLPVSVENASDFIDRLPAIHRDDTCFFVSQSGETADTLAVMQHCRAGGALCVGVTNVVGSSISRNTDFGAHLNAGAEVGVASTKAYTSQIVVLTLIALLLSRDSLSLRQRRLEVIEGLATLPSKVTETLKMVSGDVEALAEELKSASSMIVMGRGYDFPTAMEAALKVKELSYVHTEGINSGELKHGPLALIDEQLPVIALCSNDRQFAKSKLAIQQVHARKGNVVAITTVADDPELKEATRKQVVVPAVVDCLQCVINVIPFQLLSYYMALKRGNNVDCPRNLAKSVTVG